MNFVHELLSEEFKISEGEIAIMIFENLDEYIKLLDDIVDTEKNEHFYMDLKVNNKYLLIDNFMKMELNNKKILNSVYKDLELYQKKDSFYQIFSEINSKLVSELESVIFDYDLPLEIDYDFEMKNIFKAYNLRVSETYESLFEKLIDYIELNIKVFGYKIVVLFNMCLYLKDEEIRNLKSFAELNELIVVDIERVYFKYSELDLKYLLLDESLSRVL